MTCPYCNADSYVTRGNLTNATRRRRCLDCGREFGTVEIYAHQQASVQFTRQLLGIVNGNGSQ